MSHDEYENDVTVDEALQAADVVAEDVTPELGETVVLSTEPAATVAAESTRAPGRLRIARPRDPLQLRAEAEEAEALAAEQEIAEARRRVAEAEERAEAARLAAEESRAEAERRRAAAVESPATPDEVVVETDADELARDRALGRVAVVDETPEQVVAVAPVKRTTDKFWASLGLFLLRVLMAGLVGLWGFQALIYSEEVETALAKIGLQVGATNALAITMGVGLIVMAALLLLGCGTRIVAAILTAMLIVFLAFFRFGPFNPILEGQWGFYGDYELLLTVVSFLFVCMGGGGWSVDHGIRRGRERKRLENV